MCFFSCNTIIINTVKKTKHFSGLSSQQNYVSYQLVLESKLDFSINSVTLITDNVELEIQGYSFINLKTQAGHKVLDKIKKFDKGEYQFSFQVMTFENYDKEQYIIVDYVLNDKQKTSRRLIVQKEGKVINK